MKKLVGILHKNREISLFLIDTFSIIFAYLLGFLFRFIDNPVSIQNYPDHFRMMIVTMPAVLAINYVLFLVFGINKSLWKYIGLDEVARIVTCCVLANLIWFLIVYTLPVSPYIRSVPILSILFQILIMLGIRFSYRIISMKQLEKDKHKTALIIGAGSAGALLYRDILTNDKFDYRVIGFIDDNVNLTGKRLSGCPILGTVEELPEIVSKTPVDIAYVAIPSASKKRIAEIIDVCSSLNMKTQIMDYRVKENLSESSTLRDVSFEDLLGRDEVLLDTAQISDYLKDKVVMVTGGGGSIGSELCRQILRFEPKTLIVYDIYENNMYDFQQELLIRTRRNQVNLNTKVECRIGSVRDKERLNDIFEEFPINVVFHAAAHKHVPLVEDSPKEAIKNNIFGTYNVLKACIEHKADRFVLISTDKAVNPTNIMGATKRICELIVQSAKNNGVTKIGAVRFGNVLGSNGSVIPLFREQIAAGGPVTVTDPRIERYFMTIPEAASLVLQAGAYADKGDIFVLDMGTRVRIVDLAEKMITLAGFKPYEDIQIDFIGLRPGEKMYEEISLGNEKRYKTANDLVYVNEPMTFDVEKFIKELETLRDDMDSRSDDKIRNEIFRLIEEYK